MNASSQTRVNLKKTSFSESTIPSLVSSFKIPFCNKALQIYYTHTDGLYRLGSKCTILKRDEESLPTLNTSSQVAVMYQCQHMIGEVRFWEARQLGTGIQAQYLMTATCYRVLHSVPSVETG